VTFAAFDAGVVARCDLIRRLLSNFGSTDYNRKSYRSPKRS